MSTVTNFLQTITTDARVRVAQLFAEDIRRSGTYYAFASRSFPYPISDVAVPPPADTYRDAVLDTHRALIFGKKIRPEDVALSAERVDWIAGTVYPAYDDTAPFNKCYAITTVGSNRRVYKCLSNGGGQPSTAEPVGTDPEPMFSAADGYIWKYMFTIPEATWRKFATATHFPIVYEKASIESARPGAINFIEVINAGSGYHNWLVSEFESIGDISVDGNNLLYGLGSRAVSTEDFYNNCIIRITSGAARDEYRYITDYYIAGGRRVAVLNAPFTGTVRPADRFEVLPNVFVFDAGARKETNCVAVGVVGGAVNAITRVDIYESGTGYIDADAAIIADASVGVAAPAELRVVISPRTGHGSDPARELGARYVTISTQFAESEGPLLPENDYRTIGIIREPTFSNVNVRVDGAASVGLFQVGEEFSAYAAATLAGTVSVSTSSTTATGTGTNFLTSLDPGDEILVRVSGANFFTTVAAVVSNTEITMTSVPTFTAGAATIDLVKRREPLGRVIARALNEVTLADVVPRTGIRAGTRVLGTSSYATSVISSAPLSITSWGRDTSDFIYFNQLVRCVGTVAAGTFIEDEPVRQDWAVIPAEPRARLFFVRDVSAIDEDELYLTDARYFFQTRFSPDSDGVIRGMTSGSLFDVRSINSGDVTPTSGEIIYLQNLNPISRSASQTETLRITLEF